MADEHGDDRRLDRWQEGPSAGEGGWLGLSDDELLYRVNALPQDHAEDERLLAVVRSDRHFFVRQEAAKRLRDPACLKEYSGDRHIGPILVRVMKRDEDVAYLERLIAETRHLDVRKAAEAQLRAIARAKAGATGEG
jgi:hypothetical protein